MAVIEKQTGEYMKGEFVKERQITDLKIEDEPKDVSGEFGVKLECKVSFAGQMKEDPFKWTLNKKSRNVLIEHFSVPGTKFDSVILVGQTIPVETGATEKGRAIYVDEARLKLIQPARPTLAESS
jgi:hypothetical protein